MATERVTVSIKGVTCAGRVARIEQELRQQKGVIWASINFAAGQATLTYDPTAFGLKRLSQVVHELGYELQPNAAANGEAVRGGIEQNDNWCVVWSPLILGIIAALALLGMYLGSVALIHDWKYATDLLWRNSLPVVAIALSLGVPAILYIRKCGKRLRR